MVVIPWPTYPTITPKTGKVSKSKKAGKRVPWLSMNVVNNLPRPVHQQIRAMWRDATFKRVRFPNGEGSMEVIPSMPWEDGPKPYPVRLTVQLFKATSHVMDVSAVLEGSKPIVDGLVAAGVLPDDKPEYVRGIDVLPAVPVGLKGKTRVEVSWEEAA